MRIARTAGVALGAIVLFTVAESTIETHTTTRWGEDVTVRRRVCP
jgi:hypothetical protein